MDMHELKASNAALLIMHYQADVFSLLFNEQRPAILDEMNRWIAEWHSARLPVIFANFALGMNYELANQSNRLISHLTATGLFRDGGPVAGLEVKTSDQIYQCSRASVFHGTSLDTDLRSRNIDTLVMAGVATSGVVLSSVSSASDADYRVHLIKDCCFDPDQDAHEALFRAGLNIRAEII